MTMSVKLKKKATLSQNKCIFYILYNNKIALKLFMVYSDNAMHVYFNPNNLNFVSYFHHQD